MISRPVLIAALLAGVLVALPTRAEEGGRIPVRVVAGRLVVACDIQSPSRRIPANLFIEYDGAFGLQLHNRAAAALRLESADGQATPLTLRFPDWKLTVPRRELGDEEDLERFTKYHSAELGENAIVGAIGAEVLGSWRIVFDLASGTIELRTPEPATGAPEAPGSAAAPDGTIITDLTVVNGLAWLPVRYADGSPGALAVGTSRYDTMIDRAVCDRFRAPDGDIGSLRVASLDLAAMVALRPEDVIQVHPDGVAGVMGINLLEHFRLEIDREQRTAWITPTASARFPAEDRVFFRAMVDEDPEAVEAFLTEHATSRLAPEAAELLLSLRIDEEADEAVVQRAIVLVNDSMPGDLRATRMLDLMVELRNEGLDDYALAAGRTGVESGRDDRYPNTIHEIHGRLGRILLEQDDEREAWRHLLSAAFGLPEDGGINLDLGRVYERTGRPRRAFSRYVQAVIDADSAPAALAGLARVQSALEEPFSVDLVERMIAGKVRNFGAAGVYEPDPATRTERVALVEFFTSANLGDGRGGAIGGALGNQGLLGHFAPSDAVFLSYHLPAPALDPLVNPLALRTARELGVEAPTQHLVNGVHPAPGAARWRQGEAVYLACRDTIVQQLDDPTDYALALEATIESGVVRGSLEITGPAFDGLLAQVVVAERGVICPGRSEIVIHRQVARGSALGADGGTPYAPEDGRMVIEFARSLAELEQANAACLDELEAAGAGTAVRMGLAIDPGQVVLVAFLRRDISGEVMQAIQITPERPAAEREPS